MYKRQQPAHTFRSITHRITHQPRPKVPRKIQRIPRLIPKASPQPKYQEEQRQREKIRIPPNPPRIRRILERKNHKNQYRTRNELGEKLARFGQVRLRVCAEYLGCGARGGRDGAHAVSSEVVDGVDVVYVDDARGAEAAKELGEQVHGEAAPGKAAVKAVGERHGGVEVGAAVAADVDAEPVGSVLLAWFGMRWESECESVHDTWEEVSIKHIGVRKY